MAYRKIAKLELNGQAAYVAQDVDSKEYRVRVQGEEHGAEYFTDDLDDAKRTAEAMCVSRELGLRLSK